MTTVAKENIVTVEEGQYVPIPSSTEYVLGGPGKLKVCRYVDGRLSGQILEGGSVPSRLAIAKRWARLPWGV